MTISDSALTVNLFPRTGWAAHKAGEAIPFVTWSVLHRACRGRGNIGVDVAIQVIMRWRGVSRRTAERSVRMMEDRFYAERGVHRVFGAELLYLTGIARVMRRLSVEHEAPSRLVPAEVLRTPKQMRAQLYAACHEIPGHSQRFKNGPLSRETKARITCVSRTAQKRYDEIATVFVQRCVARIDTVEPVGFVGHGYYVGRDGHYYRRLPDYRVPSHQVRASKTRSRHANRKARALDNDPVDIPRGHSRPDRTYFTAATASKAARRANARQCVLGWGRAGSMEFVIREGGATCFATGSGSHLFSRPPFALWATGGNRSGPVLSRP